MSHQAAQPAASPLAAASTAGNDPTHEVRVVDGRFASASCSCGWQGTAKRQRSAVRAEARDHALLYAGAALPSAADQDGPEGP